LDQQVWHEIETIDESGKMQYITSVERISIAKGGYQLKTGQRRLNPGNLSRFKLVAPKDG
jgi:hypothetical protein